MSTPTGDEVRLRTQIDEASKLVRVAEAELDQAVAQLRPLQIGDKGLTSDSLEGAFEKLRAARTLVKNLREVLVSSQRPAG